MMEIESGTAFGAVVATTIVMVGLGFCIWSASNGYAEGQCYNACADNNIECIRACQSRSHAERQEELLRKLRKRQHQLELEAQQGG